MLEQESAEQIKKIFLIRLLVDRGLHGLSSFLNDVTYDTESTQKSKITS